MRVRMKGESLKNPYSKELERGKLGMLKEWSLRRCGRKDFGRGVVLIDKNEKYSSPFIEQQMSFLEVAIRNEKEKLNDSILKLQIQIKTAKLQIDDMKKQIEQSYNDGDVIQSKNHDSYVEKETKYIKQTISSLNKSILQAECNIEKKRANTQSKCEKLCYIAKARINAYWSGVLQASNSKNDNDPLEIREVYIFEKSELNLFNPDEFLFPLLAYGNETQGIDECNLIGEKNDEKA